jgi:O-6-methylguanine DNA methyltransferase
MSDEPESGPIAATAVAAPWGPVHLAATRRGIVAVELMTTREAFIDKLERRLHRSITWVSDKPAPNPPGSGDNVDPEAAKLARRASGAIETAVARAGQRRLSTPDLDELPLDLGDRPAWDRAVLGAVRAIPRGEVRSYGDIARAIGRPGAARAVGGAVGRNPVAFLVPCHRVVAGDGTLGGYGGGWWGDHERLLELKAELLALEGVALPRSRSSTSRGR